MALLVTESVKLRKLLGEIYVDHCDEELSFVWSQLMQILDENSAQQDSSLGIDKEIWDASSVVLITYPDAIYKEGETTLKTLSDILDSKFGILASIIHILPFLPSTSDGGFAVSNHEQIEDAFGNWKDLKKLSLNHILMADLVLNHVSSSHDWVKQFILSQKPGDSYILSPKTLNGWENVIRPRNSSLFTTLKTKQGDKKVWTTFGPDQIDLDWSDPNILIEFLKLLVRYIRNGVQWIRLDAVAFLWKEPNTSCLHLKQVHEIVQLLRLELSKLNPMGVLITETNVPEKENLSYLKGGDKAHIAYNFPLPPLLLEAILASNADLINEWLSNWSEMPNQTTLLNFTASHDGVGLRPLEGIMNNERMHDLLVKAEKKGGLISHRRMSNGQDKPYELNISWWSAMADDGHDTTRYQIERFFMSQALVLAIKGVPAFYLQALLASPNDIKKFKRSGERRDLNREKFEVNKLLKRLNDNKSSASKNLKLLNNAMKIRSTLNAFNPNSPMRCFSESQNDFILLERGYPGEQIYAIYNVTDKEVSLNISELLVDVTKNNACQYDDCLSKLSIVSNNIKLTPYKVMWLKPSFKV